MTFFIRGFVVEREVVREATFNLARQVSNPPANEADVELGQHTLGLIFGEIHIDHLCKHRAVKWNVDFLDQLE